MRLLNANQIKQILSNGGTLRIQSQSGHGVACDGKKIYLFDGHAMDELLAYFGNRVKPGFEGYQVGKAI